MHRGPGRLCSNPFASVTLKLCSKVLQIFLFCLNAVPCHPTKRDLCSVGDNVQRCLLAGSRSPLLAWCTGHFSKAPHLAPGCHIGEGSQLKPNSLTFFPTDSHSWSCHWRQRGLAKKVVLRIHVALKESHSSAVYGDSGVVWCCTHVLQTMLSHICMAKATLNELQVCPKQKLPRCCWPRNTGLKVNLLFHENLQKDRSKNYLCQLLACRPTGCQSSCMHLQLRPESWWITPTELCVPSTSAARYVNAQNRQNGDALSYRRVSRSAWILTNSFSFLKQQFLASRQD